MNLADIFSNYFTVREELIRAVAGLSREQLDWTPAEHPASIGRLLAHIADCECYWIGEIAGSIREKPDYTRFDAAQTRDELLDLLKEFEDLTAAYMADGSTDDWDQVFYPVVRDGNQEKVSRRWLIWHVVEHQARHRGQIFMLMRMQGLEVADV